MVLFVFLLGAIAILLGVGAIVFGVPINEFGLGNTLIVAGTTTMSAGFVVLALAAVLRAIERIGRPLPQAIPASSEADKEVVRRRAAPPPAERDGAADEWPRPEPIPPVRADVPPRERMEMPAAAGRPPWSRARDEAPRTGAPVGHAEQGAASAQEPYAEQGREPLIDARLEREPETTEPSESHDAIHADRREGPPAKAPERRRFFAWTRRSSATREAAGEPAEPHAEPGLSESVARAEAARQRDREDREAIRRMARQPVERPGREARAEPVAKDLVEVLKSGTVGDMAYTLYTDGSIDAEFAEGKLRFESIEHLRRHLEEQGP
jgi:hypothetical protein